MAAAKREPGEPPKGGVPVPPIYCKVTKDGVCFTVRFFYTKTFKVGTECQPNMIIKLPFTMSVAGMQLIIKDGQGNKKNCNMEVMNPKTNPLAPGVIVCPLFAIGGKTWKIADGAAGARSPWGGVPVGDSGTFAE